MSTVICQVIIDIMIIASIITIIIIDSIIIIIIIIIIMYFVILMFMFSICVSSRSRTSSCAWRPATRTPLLIYCVY